MLSPSHSVSIGLRRARRQRPSVSYIHMTTHGGRTLLQRSLEKLFSHHLSDGSFTMQMQFGSSTGISRALITSIPVS